MINDCYVKEEHENGLLSCYLNLTSVSYSVELRWYGLPLLTMCEDQVRQSSQWLLIPVKEAVSWSSMSSTGKPHSPASLLLAVAVGLTSSCKHLNRSDTCHFHAKPMIRCRHVPSCLCPSGNSMTRTDLWRGTVLQMAEWPTARVLEGFCIATQDQVTINQTFVGLKIIFWVFYITGCLLTFLILALSQMFTPFERDFTVEMTVIQESWATMIPQSRHLYDRAKIHFSLLNLLVLGLTCDTLLLQPICPQFLLFPSQSQPPLPTRNRRNLESFWIANRLLLQLLYSLWSVWMCSFNFYLSDKLRGRS